MKQFIGTRGALVWTLLCLAACSLTACNGGGGGSDRPGQPAFVTEMSVKDDQISVGDGTVLFTDIAFNSDDVFFFGDRIGLVIKLPDGLRYRSDTAELDGGGRDTDLFPRVTSCVNGESFIEFDLDSTTLNNAAPPNGDSDARVKLTVDATSTVGTVDIAGRAARNGFSFDCNESFSADAYATLTVD